MISKEAKVAELAERASQITGIPGNELRLSNKEVASHSHISVEQLNTELRLEKSLE